MKDTGVAVGTVVAIGSGPAFAGLLGRLTDGTPLSRRWGIATALACAGVALLVLGGDSASISLPGVGLALLAGAGYATYTVTAKGLLDAGHAPEAVMAATFGVGGVLLVPVLVATAGDWLLTPGGLGLVAYLAVVPTAVAYVLFARGLRRLPAGEAATLTLAEPLTATALGALVLAERPSAVALAGAGLVLAGLVSLARGGARPGARAHRGARRRDRRRRGRGGALSSRPQAAEALAAALRAGILDGRLGPAERLREVDLATTHGAARHTVRAALRALAAEGLVVIEPNRGASVARLGPEDVAGLHALRVILEVGAARMALERGGGRLPAAVHEQAAALAAVCRRDPEPPWSEIVTAHGELHEALVAAAGHPTGDGRPPRAVHRAAAVLVQARPHFSAHRLADDHLALVAGLEAEGTAALERHLEDSATVFGTAPVSSPAAVPAAPAPPARTATT